MNPLVELIRSQPGMADRLLADHADDGSGRCRVCSNGGQTGRYRWPCSIHYYASLAYELQQPDQFPSCRRVKHGKGHRDDAKP